MTASSIPTHADTENRYLHTSTLKDFEAPTLGLQESTTSRFTVLLCGNAKLESAELADILHVDGQLGRRKLNGLNKANLASVISTDVLWMSPKKYWTVSKSATCMQDVFLDVVYAYIADKRDVVIIAPKDYGWKNKNPRSDMYCFETPSRFVFCTRNLDLTNLVEDSKDEELFSLAIAQALTVCRAIDRVGVRQSYKNQSSTNVVTQSYLGKVPKTKVDADKSSSGRHTKTEQQKTSKPKKDRRKDYKTDKDEYDLGDHTTNDDKPTAKPNYAKEFQQNKQKQTKKMEKGTDDCGDDVTAIDLDDTTPLAAFIDLDDVSTADPASSNTSSLGSESEGNNQKLFFSNIDELATFVETETFDETTIQSSFPTQKAYYKTHVMEIFGGFGGVTRISIRRGLSVGKLFDLNAGIDLLKTNEKNKLLTYIEDHKPEVIVMGPPCTAFSGWARYNMTHAFEAWNRSYAIGYPLALLSAQVAKLQLKSGRHFLTENPWSSTIWFLPTWQEILPQCHVAYCEQCVFELQDAAGEPTLKPTAFVASCEILVERLRQECNGRHAKHAPLQGTLHGMSKTSYAQQWPPKLCQAIVLSIEKLCCFKDGTQQVYAGEASSSSSAPPSKCPGCRAHAYRRDPRHSRIEGECKFVHDTPDSFKCIACTRNLPSHHPTHTQIAGECHWAEATTRLASGRAQSSRGPQPTRHVVEGAPLDAPSAPLPPDTNLGKWRRIEELEIISALEEICYFDGWHEWDSNSKALVSSNTRYMREPQPRYTNSDFPLRSTYGQFVEHSHTHGNWYQLEDHVEYKDLDRSIGYPVERMVNIYHPSVASSSSTENKTGNQDQAANIDESQQVRRVTIKDKPEVVEPREYGEDEVEIPEVSIGREAATKQDDETTETATPVDWSSMDLGTSFRELRSQDRSLVIRALRKLHLRWWHASNTKMHKLLEQAGAPQLALDLIKSVVDTCRICRSWKRPTAKSMSHVSQAQQFNEKVQLDLLFTGDEVILHLCDECTRFSVAELIKSRETSDILGAIKNSWIKYFNVPQLLVSDSEGALGSEEAAIWAERLGTSFRLLPRGAHATIVERHHETLRQLIHRISSQLKAERLTVNMTDIVAEAVRAKNSLLVINGFTPFQAVLGRTPNLLGESENPTVSMTADWVGGADSKHSTRLREIAVTAMVEGSAQERIKRAQTSQTRLAGEQLELAINDLVDVYRTPRTKDNTGWRGPAKVVSIAGMEQGHVEVQWGSRVMSCRIQDIRKALMYPAMLQNDDHAFEVIRHHATNLSNTCETYGMICTSKGWQLSQAAAQRPHVFYAMLRVAHDVFQLPRCIGGRVGRGVAHTKGMYGTENSVLIWWPHNCPQLYRSMSCSAMTDLNLKELFGEDWVNHCWVRFFGVDEASIEPVRRIGVDIPYLGGEPGDPRQPGTPRPNPVTPIPMDEDDTLMTDHRSTAPSDSTRIVTPMSTDHGRPPPQPPRMPQRILRQSTPVNTDRTRSRNVSTNNSTQPSTSSPVITTSTSNRGTTGTMTPQQIKSPRGDKRTPTFSDNSNSSSTKQMHKQQRKHNTPASSSNTPPPTQPDTTHEPLLPIEDDTDDDATIAQDETETDLYTLLSPWNADEFDGVDTWDAMFTTKHAPPQYHVWEAFPGVDELCAEQEHYLMRSTVTQTHQEMRRDTSQSDGPEIELGPGMAAWFVGMPKLEPDEILVFKTANKTTSTQIEKNYDALTAQDIRTHHKLVDEAIRKELSSFVEHKAFARAPRSQCGNICSSRWVLRWKEVDGKRIVKARLTIRGFEDLTEVPSYASTATRWTQRLVVSIAVQRNWSLFIADVSTAFLRGMSFQELATLTESPVREVAFTPPKGAEKYFTELKGFHDLNFSVEVLRLLKAVYGLRDAPRAWRLRLDMELRKLGGTPLPTDSALYCFYSQSKELESLISTHVDDLKCCGTPERTKKIIDGLERAFGKLKMEHDNFLHCGLKHEKISDGYQVHQNHYAEQLRCIDTSSLDLAQPDKFLSEELQSAYLSLLGGLSWLIQTRLDIAIYVCALQRAASKATTGHVLKLNKLTKWVRRKQFMLVYRKITGKCKLLTISDSAFKTEPCSALAMRGAILGIGEEDHKENGSIVHVLEFYARKQKRVCRSTFAAELNAIADAVEIARLINFTIACCYRPFTTPLELQQLEDNNQLPLAIEVYTDCRSVYDALAAEDVRTPTEASLVLILHVLKELLRSRLISKLTWVHTDDMLADGLTKGGVSRKALFTFSLSGRWKLKHECRSHSERTKAFQKTIALALPQAMRQ